MGLSDELKKKVIEYLKLEDIGPEDIIDDEPLFGEGLGLDSIDALELIIMLEKEYGIKVQDIEIGKKIFQTFDSMREYIEANK